MSVCTGFTPGAILRLQEASLSAVRIVTSPDVMLGKPVVEGTRITVELIPRETLWRRVR